MESGKAQGSRSQPTGQWAEPEAQRPERTHTYAPTGPLQTAKEREQLMMVFITPKIDLKAMGQVQN